ncbi:LOW QUALITY PROTEIN: hypothetical protein NC652_031164 [Populus alba x Populus x berolinensis]|nr:LOW QUALITY PROTEIN: hypothetical protein NC652_031164 [Populus alba x Populus x berolinensis]
MGMLQMRFSCSVREQKIMQGPTTTILVSPPFDSTEKKPWEANTEGASSWSRPPSIQASEITNSSHLSLFPTLPDISVAGIIDGSDFPTKRKNSSLALPLCFPLPLWLISNGFLTIWLVFKVQRRGRASPPPFFSIMYLYADILEGLSIVRPSPHVVWLLSWGLVCWMGSLAGPLLDVVLSSIYSVPGTPYGLVYFLLFITTMMFFSGAKGMLSGPAVFWWCEHYVGMLSPHCSFFYAINLCLARIVSLLLLHAAFYLLAFASLVATICRLFDAPLHVAAGYPTP